MGLIYCVSDRRLDKKANTLAVLVAPDGLAACFWPSGRKIRTNIKPT